MEKTAIAMIEQSLGYSKLNSFLIIVIFFQCRGQGFSTGSPGKLFLEGLQADLFLWLCI